MGRKELKSRLGRERATKRSDSTQDPEAIFKSQCQMYNINPQDPNAHDQLSKYIILELSGDDLRRDKITTERASHRRGVTTYDPGRGSRRRP